MALLAKSKNSGPVSDQSMHFWGVCCESGKQYAQVVGQRFRITMAVLDPKSSSNDETDRTVSLIVIRGGIEYLLCVLKHEEIHQVNLNLIFDKGENVVFYINGHGKVYLSGYQLTDSETDVLNDESGYLCPLVEVKTSKFKTEKKSKLPKSPQKAEPESSTPKSKKKAKVEKGSPDDMSKSPFLNSSAGRSKNGEVKLLGFEGDSDESDEDFSPCDELVESEEESEECGEEDDIIDDSEIEEIVKDIGEEDFQHIQERIIESRKRKRSLEKLTAQDDTFNDKDASDSDDMNSSIGRTPIPQKQTKMEESSEKKKPKKKKKSLNDSASEKSVEDEPKSPAAGQVPGPSFSEGSTPNKNPVQKLAGGVEIQDIIVGRGPAATKGKMVHVFYVGRLKNKQIFDSRLPGKKPFSFKLGAQQVIKGWDVGLQGMKVGGKRKVKIPPNMGYGSAEVETIPPNSTLFFLVELQAIS